MNIDDTRGMRGGASVLLGADILIVEHLQPWLAADEGFAFSATRRIARRGHVPVRALRDCGRAGIARHSHD